MNPCGDCTACCEGWLRGDVHGVIMEPGTPCTFLNKLCVEGCAIYKDRPKMCKDYSCVYLTFDLDESFRPNECGFIMTTRKKTDKSKRYISVELIRNVEYNDFITKMNYVCDKLNLMYCVKEYFGRRLYYDSIENTGL